MTDPANLIRDDNGLVCEPLVPRVHHAIRHVHFFTPLHRLFAHVRHSACPGHVHHHCFWDTGGPAGSSAGDDGGLPAFDVGGISGGDGGVDSGFGGFGGGGFGDDSPVAAAYYAAKVGLFDNGHQSQSIIGYPPSLPVLPGSTVPELPTHALLLLGFGALVWRAWRRRAVA